MAQPPSPGDLRKLPNPPKFGGPGGGQVSWPQNLSEAVSFTRWLVSLWRVASESVNLPEALAAARTPGRQGSDQETLSAAQALTFRPNRLPQDPSEIMAQIVARASRPSGDVDLGQIRAKQSWAPPGLRPDDLNALTAASLTRTAPRGRHSSDGMQRLWGRHPIVGTGSTDGVTNVLTWVSGDQYYPEMVGHRISIAWFAQFTVTQWVDATHIKVSPIVATASTWGVYFDEFPPTDYADGQFRWYTDWTCIYVANWAEGTVDVAGSTVTWVSGDFFNPYWAGKPITIDGLAFHIVLNQTDPVTPTTFEIDGAATLSGVHYSVDSGVWIYAAGQYDYPTLPLPTAVLGLQDEGLIVYNDTYKHSWRWTGTAYHYAPGDPGSQYFVGGTPEGGAWVACDGAAHTCSQDDGTTTSVTPPALNTGAFLRVGGSAPSAATAPTLDGSARTEDESTHTHDVDLGPLLDVATPGAGFPFNFVDPGTVTSGPGSAHYHDLDDTHLKYNPPSDGAGGLPDNVGIDWYMRL